MQRKKNLRKNSNRKYAKGNFEHSSEDSASSRTALISPNSRVPMGCEELGRSSEALDSHQLGPESVDDGTQGQATPPGCGQVGDVDVLVALGLLLAPG